MWLYRWPMSRLLRVSSVRSLILVGVLGKGHTASFGELGKSRAREPAVSPAESGRVICLVLLLAGSRVGVGKSGRPLDRLRGLHTAHAVEFVTGRRRATLVFGAAHGVATGHAILKNTTKGHLVALRRAGVRVGITAIVVSRRGGRCHDAGIRGVAHVVRLSAAHRGLRPTRKLLTRVRALRSAQRE